jgi:hypothetical protein
METGHRGATPRDVRDLCDVYEVTDPAQRDHLMALAREGKQQGWWQAYDLTYARYVGLEAEAVSIRDYQSSVVPGLLQTVEYARAGHEGTMPRRNPEAIEQLIEAKLTRQRLLTKEDPPRFMAVLDEAVLHRAAGGPRVMAAQLTRIIDAVTLPSITVQVIPFSVGAHPGVESNFNILELPRPTPGIVFVEGLVGSVYLERAEDLDRYIEIFEHLQAIALNPKETNDLLVNVRNEYRNTLKAVI